MHKEMVLKCSCLTLPLTNGEIEGVATISRGVEDSAILQSAVILDSDIIAFGWCQILWLLDIKVLQFIIVHILACRTAALKSGQAKRNHFKQLQQQASRVHTCIDSSHLDVIHWIRHDCFA